MKKNKIILLLFFSAAVLYGNISPKYPALFSDEKARENKVKLLNEKAMKQKTEAESWAHANNFQIRYEENGVLHEIIRIENNKPVYYITHNVNAAISSAANLVRNISPYNLNGTNIIVGVWDAGSVLSTHQEFDGRVTVKDGSVSHNHSTHVGGTIGAKGIVANAKGMAPSVKIDSYDWSSDEAEMAARAAATPNQTTKIYVSNHSYGTGAGWNNTGTRWPHNITQMYEPSFGQYNYTAWQWDDVAYDAPYFLACKSSGNDRNDNPSNGSIIQYYSGGSWHSVTYDYTIHPGGDGNYKGGYDCISTYGNAKNILTVGAVNDAVSGGTRNLASATISSFSSWGPADDGRIKPDVVGNGVLLYSCDNGNNSDYTSMSGTSMSSPNVCGSAALLIQYYRDLNSTDMRSSTLKALILHTADDIGRPGPDYSYGWGLMNTKAAADIISADASLSSVTTKITEGLLDAANPDDEFSFSIDGTKPFKTTICWTDPPGNYTTSHDNRTPVLVNDLDIRIISPDGTTNFPFVLDVNNPGSNATTGDNILDNVEQIIINTGSAPGIYTVSVSHKGLSAIYGSQQYYSLIVSGAVPEPVFIYYLFFVIHYLLFYRKK